MRIAFVFPGQGSQSVGMLGGFAENETVQRVMARADEALGFSLTGLIAEGPAETLSLTVNTQPAMLASSVAFYEAWLAAGGRAPEMMAGHSLGEYSALCAAGAMDLETAVRLVRFRAEAMQSAVPVGVGGMAAVMGLADADVEAACEEARAVGRVEAVNFNAPGQVVIAGEKEAVARAIECAKARGCRRAIVLPVSAPFHSSLMQPAADKLAERLAATDIKVPATPVIANIDVEVHETPDAIREALARQAAGAVQWVRTIERMKAAGITDIVECGPGKVLTGLLRRTAPEINGHNIFDAASLAAVLEKLK
ncbi:MAG: ACP S-malonyltransferase [Sutterella wadsworthensis]|nr:ACP S-malonyltransferase [Sutterella wadsworthensis]